jgi:eukaryotic-like serine/threonine-protein kinase
MLPEELSRSITSIDEPELEELYLKFCEKSGTDKDDEFVSELYKNDRINTEELKSFQFLKKIEFTAIADMSNVNVVDVPHEQGAGGHTQTDFTMLESIDQGGMGEILIAKDNELGRTVAFKKIHEHVAKVPSYLGRFFMEAQVTAQLQHPNIVPVYEMKVDGNNAGYAMKLIQGKTLAGLITETKNQLDKRGKLGKRHNLSARLEHFLKVCDAMHYAHRKGVIHRDLKPLNVMVGPFNEVYVMDWGIAKIISVDDNVFDDLTEKVDSTGDDDTGDTKPGQLLGTPAYMSPEQANGQNDIIDHRSDLFSLGLILFELVTLRRAYVADEKYKVIEKAELAKLAVPVRYPRQPSIPKQLIAIIRKATQLDPDDRYATVDALADDIRRYMRGAAIKARRDTLVQKLMRWMNRHRLAVLNIVVYTVILSLVVVSWSFYQQQQARIAVQLQGQRMNHFISAVSEQAQSIDTQFLKYEGILQGVASSAVDLLEGGHPDPGRFYDYKDFDDPELAPPDLAESTVYGSPISVGWHANKLAPGVEYEQVEDLVRIINPLRHTFKRMILKSHHTAIAVDDHKTAMSVIKDLGLPLVWTYVGLEEGIMAEYPGQSAFPPDYDPRKRPWYVTTLKNEGTSCWMPPYIDVHGRGVLLPCTSKLYNTGGKFLGVAVVEMTLDYIRHELMSLSDIRGVENTYLLNDRAEIVVDSAETAKTYERLTLINSMDDLKTYSHKGVVKNIRQDKSGYISYKEHGKEKLLAYYRLNSIGWYYLAIVDASKILETKTMADVIQ